MPKRYHFIAIGGSIMHSLAIALKNAGHKVSGSDDAIYGVSRMNLDDAGLLPDYEGWNPEIITTDIDQVILGMHARKDNPELQKARELNLPIRSFPEFVHEYSKDKKRVVIAGSHGKTSTSAMIIHVLDELGLPFDYLLGAPPKEGKPLVRLSEAPVIIIEGDEYLTSPEDPRPKFMHYKPHIALVNGIAWDHANVFPTKEIYLEQFRSFIESLNEDCSLLYYSEDKELTELVRQSPARYKLGYKPLADKISDGITFIKLANKTTPLKVFGAHNMQNLSGALEVLRLLGISDKDISAKIKSFEGARNRLQVLASGKNTIYTDFAHSPSKVKATIEAVANQTDRSLVAVLELHTFSSLNKAFLPEYKNCMKSADTPVVFFNPEVLRHKKLPELTSGEIETYFGQKISVFTDIHNLNNFLLSQSAAQPDYLFMSSGDFGGLDIETLGQQLLTNESQS